MSKLYIALAGLLTWVLYILPAITIEEWYFRLTIKDLRLAMSS